jgi:hypothetical protein
LNPLINPWVEKLTQIYTLIEQKSTEFWVAGTHCHLYSRAFNSLAGCGSELLPRRPPRPRTALRRRRRLRRARQVDRQSAADSDSACDNFARFIVPSHVHRHGKRRNSITSRIPRHMHMRVPDLIRKVPQPPVLCLHASAVPCLVPPATGGGSCTVTVPATTNSATTTLVLQVAC